MTTPLFFNMKSVYCDNFEKYGRKMKEHHQRNSEIVFSVSRLT